MALKKKLTKDEHEKLSDAFKKEYKQVGDDFVLDIDGEEDIGALKRAKDHEKSAREIAEKKLKDIEDAQKAKDEEIARKSGDLVALEKSYKDKAETDVAKEREKVKKRDAVIERVTVDAAAKDLAHKISNAPNLILPHIRSRMRVEWNDDEPVARILDNTGKPSAMTLDDLGNEFVANKDFSAIILSSRATGGARVPTTGGGAPNVPNPLHQQGNKPADLARESPSNIVAMLDANKAATGK
jgi:hypothetical protein